jgi:AcrR family transcriptional regulator
MPSQKSSVAVSAGAREPKRERGKLRVAALLDAGAAVFAEKGYDAATMTEIAARANTAIGSLYQFFPSKEALADAFLSRYSERITNGFQEVAARAATLSPPALADTLVQLFLDNSLDRRAAIALADARSIAAERRALLRQAIREQIAAILLAVDSHLSKAKAVAMGTVILHILKALPALSQEEAEGGTGLVAEAREAIKLYILHGRAEDAVP